MAKLKEKKSELIYPFKYQWNPREAHFMTETSLELNSEGVLENKINICS